MLCSEADFSAWILILGMSPKTSSFAQSPAHNNFRYKASDIAVCLQTDSSKNFGGEELVGKTSKENKQF